MFVITLHWPHIKDESTKYSGLEGEDLCNRSRAPEHRSFPKAKTFFYPVSIEKQGGGDDRVTGRQVRENNHGGTGW